MADMTTKHFTLIQDAINEGIKEVMRRLTDEAGNVAPNLRAIPMRRCMIECFGNAFASRLRYTHDKFDASGFCGGLR